MTRDGDGQDGAALAATLTSDSPQSSRGTESTPWSTIGRFTVDAKLGEGGMGIVLLATDTALGRRVALKLLRAGSDSSAEQRARFMREAQVMARLTHENVVVVYEVGEHEGRTFVAMEYVEGTTLNGWGKHKSWSDIVDIFLRAGRGLEAAHRVGLVHRDFKPDNVLVGTDGRVRVTDFGLAGFDASDSTTALAIRHANDVSVAGLTQTGALMGTPRYMAPEQHRREGLDARADQYAFCVALYESLYGAPPFNGTTYAELAASVLEGSLPAPPDDATVPPSVRDALLRGLSRQPSDRFPSMTELLGALEAARAAPSPPRRSLVPAIAISSVVAAAAVAGVIAFGRDREPAAARPAPPPPAPPAAGSNAASAIPADDDNPNDDRIRVIIGTLDGDAMTEGIREKSRPDIAAMLQKLAPDIRVRLTPRASDAAAGKRDRAYRLDISLTKLDVTDGKVRCEVRQMILAYPDVAVLASANGNATVVVEGHGLKELDLAGAECIQATLENVLDKQLVPFLRRRATGSATKD